MEIIYNVVIPIIASLGSGLIGGLLVFLGIKKVLDKDKKLNEELKEEKNQEINNVIKEKRPELTITQNPYNIVKTEELYLVPYINPELKDEKTITFKYTDEIFENDYWDKYEIILQNTGKREIQSMFLLLEYKCMANVYSKIELESWKNHWIRDYYNDELNLFASLNPDEKTKLIVYFPKKYAKMADIPMDLYMHDEDGNYWRQSYVNYERHSKSEIIDPDAYYMHLHQECNQWFIYDHMYYAKDIKKSFSTNSFQMHNLLEGRKKKCWAREEKHRQYVWDVNNGKMVLNHNYPIK